MERATHELTEKHPLFFTMTELYPNPSDLKKCLCPLNEEGGTPWRTAIF